MHARITPCGHVFCQPCATTWFRSDAACPVCRHSVEGLAALIPLYDQDAGLQSSPFGLGGDDCVDTSGDVTPRGGGPSGDAHSREFSILSRSSGASQNGTLEGATSGEGGRTLEAKNLGEKEFGPKNGGEDEDVQVRYVLGKVTDRWHHVMIERAKLKVQVARLEKTKHELLGQLQRVSDDFQRVTDENTVLRDALNARSGLVTRRRTSQYSSGLEKQHEPWESRALADNAISHWSGGLEAARRISYPEPCGYGLVSGQAKTPPLIKQPEKVIDRLKATKWELVHTFAMHSGPVHGIAVNPSGNLVATASWDHLCKVYDVHLEEEVAVLSGHELGLYAVKFSPSRRDMVGTVSSDRTCRLWNAENGECLRILEGHTDEVNGLAFKNGTHLLATASDDMKSKIWDAEKGLCVTSLKGHRHGVYGVCFQPQGHLVATASFDLTTKLWDPRSAGSIHTLEGHREDVIGVDFDSSGNLLATGSDDKTCRVWDLRTGNALVVLEEHCGEVKRVVFSPFSRLLATTCGDTTVRLFDTSTFECLHVLSSHSDHVFDVAWSPSADFLVTASHDHLWKLWLPKMPDVGYALMSLNFSHL